jgi:cytochrome c-type biogenesis protein CcmH
VPERIAGRIAGLAQIKQYLTARYGDYILYKPPLERRTALLWAGPALLVLIGLFMLFAYARRVRAVSPVPRPGGVAADQAALKKILDETP